MPPTMMGAELTSRQASSTSPLQSLSMSYAEEDGDTKILAGDTQTLLEVTYTPDDTSASYCTLSVHSDRKSVV